jgi:hypothetical protein
MPFKPPSPNFCPTALLLRDDTRRSGNPISANSSVACPSVMKVTTASFRYPAQRICQNSLLWSHRRHSPYSVHLSFLISVRRVV